MYNKKLEKIITLAGLLVSTIGAIMLAFSVEPAKSEAGSISFITGGVRSFAAGINETLFYRGIVVLVVGFLLQCVALFLIEIMEYLKNNNDHQLDLKPFTISDAEIINDKSLL